MLAGKYWLTPDGEVSVAGTEHANYVKRLMLDLTPDLYVMYAPVQRTFDGITEEEAQVHRARGVPENVIQFLLDRRDPRNFAMAEWGWVRTERSTFNSWFFDDATLTMVRDCTGYWRIQRPNIDKDTRIDWNVMAINEVFRVNVVKLLNPEVPATGLIRLSAVEKFKNPGTRYSPCCAVSMMPVNGKLVCTKCASTWEV